MNALKAIFGGTLGVENNTAATAEEVYDAAAKAAAELHREILRETYAPPVYAAYSRNSTDISDDNRDSLYGSLDNREEYSAMNMLVHGHFVGYGGEKTDFS